MAAVKDTLRDGICTITLNRPDRKNAMNTDLLTGLYNSLTKADKEGASIIIIRGSGGAFCAGGDLVEFKESTDTGPRINAMADILHKSLMTIRNTSAIVIAVLEGVAVGAGIGLSLACDLTLAVKTAVINLGYRRIGLTPDGGGSIFLARLVGAKRFNELYLLSRNVTMAEALDLGLVNFLCEENEVEEKLAELVNNVRSLPMETIRNFKDLVNHSLFFGLEQHLDKEKFYVTEFGGNPLFKQRLAEFFKKR